MAKRGYHHGNLKQALIDAALTLIAERGPTGFTLSEAAKQAGVTPAAVYRHFKGRDDLIAEAARQGFEMFADLMEFAYDKGQPSALSAFESMGRAYLAFARSHAGHYIAMFESGLSVNRSPELAAASARARHAMERAAEDLIVHVAPEKRIPASVFTSHIWAMSHGVVELYARHAPGATTPFTPEDLLESGLGIYLRGLGVLDDL